MAEKKTASKRVVPGTVENMAAPEIFASDANFFAIGPGTVTVTFVSYRWDNTVAPAVQRGVVVSRLVMPINGAQRLASGLYDFLVKNGFDPNPKPVDAGRLQ